MKKVIKEKTNKTPRVSVLTPLYNTNLQYLCECIESILNQTFTDFEFILLNDSPDNTRLEKVVESYNDPRIRYIKNDKNMGISASRNRLIDLARGEYLAVLDHDDISMPDRLQRQVEFLDAHPDVGVVSGWLQWFGGEITTIGRTPEFDVDIKVDLTVNSALMHTASMIRKSVLIDNNIRYEEEFSPAEDYRLWTRLWDVTNFYNIQDVLVKYRWYGNNTTKAMLDKMKRAALAGQLAVRDAHPAFYEEYKRIHSCACAPAVYAPDDRVKDWRLRLFGKIPFLKRRKQWILLFDCIPVLKVRD